MDQNIYADFPEVSLVPHGTSYGLHKKIPFSLTSRINENASPATSEPKYIAYLHM